MIPVWHFIGESILVFLFHSAQSLAFLDQFLKDNWSLSLTALCLPLLHREYREHGRKLPSDCRRHLQERRFCGWTCTDTKLVTVMNLVTMEGCTAVFSFLFFIWRTPWLVLSSCTDFKRTIRLDSRQGTSATGTEITVLKTSKCYQIWSKVSLFPSSFFFGGGGGGWGGEVGCLVGDMGWWCCCFFVLFVCLFTMWSQGVENIHCDCNYVKRNMFFCCCY